MRHIVFVCAIVLGLAFVPPARAAVWQDLPPVAIGPEIGTTGIGFEATVPLLPGRLNLNTGFATFGLTHEITADSTRFHGKLRLGAVPIFLSVYPFRSSAFHLDAGLYVNENRVSVVARAPTGTHFTINGHHYTAADIGTLSGRTHFNTAAPYVGFGFGDPFRGGPWSFTFNAGVMFEGSPNIRLAASNPQILLIPGAKADIKQEQHTLNHKASFVRFFPVVELGVVYRF